MLLPKWAWKISLKLRKFTLHFLFSVVHKRVLKSVQSPCMGAGLLPLSRPGYIWTVGYLEVTCLRDVGRRVLSLPCIGEITYYAWLGWTHYKVPYNKPSLESPIPQDSELDRPGFGSWMCLEITTWAWVPCRFSLSLTIYLHNDNDVYLAVILC